MCSPEDTYSRDEHHGKEGIRPFCRREGKVSVEEVFRNGYGVLSEYRKKEAQG